MEDQAALASGVHVDVDVDGIAFSHRIPAVGFIRDSQREYMNGATTSQ
jgi:hypothetical protein